MSLPVALDAWLRPIGEAVCTHESGPIRRRVNNPGSKHLNRVKPGQHILLIPAVAVLTLVSLLLFGGDSTGDRALLDDDLCPIQREAITAHSVVLFDFTKPVDADKTAIPGDILRDLTLQLGRNSELQAFALTGSGIAPRVLLKRLCKPYANAALQVGAAKDQSGSVRDCDDLPAQLADGIRSSATRFCASRNVLDQRLSALARNARPSRTAVAGAPLIEALEVIRRELEERSGPKSLHVFSDMMQHSHWYSHLDLEWTDWNDAAPPERSGFRGSVTQHRWNPDTSIELYYVPRQSLTDQPRTKHLHQRYWRNYFSGTRVLFRGQPAMAAYTAEPLMGLPSKSDLLAQEQAANDRLLARISREQEALARAQQALSAERQRLAVVARQSQTERVLLENRVEPESQPELQAPPDTESNASKVASEIEPLDAQVARQ